MSNCPASGFQYSHRIILTIDIMGLNMRSLIFTKSGIYLFLFLALSNANYADTSDQYLHGMYVVITGSGSGPMTYKRGGSGVAVVVDGKVLQFDAGPKTREHLFLSNILPEHKIDYLFFTHLHADHTSDFVDMNAWRNSTFRRDYKIFGPASTKRMTKAASDFILAHESDAKAMVTKVPFSRH